MARPASRRRTKTVLRKDRKRDFSTPPHGEEPMERQGSPSSSEPVPDAAAVEHQGALEGALALPAKPPKWEIASKWLEFDEPSALGPPPPPAPMALGRRIATPFSCSTVEPSRAASSSKAHAEPVDATEARTERDELSVLRAELAEAQAQIRESASARGGCALHEGTEHRVFEEQSVGAASKDVSSVCTEEQLVKRNAVASEHRGVEAVVSRAPRNLAAPVAIGEGLSHSQLQDRRRTVCTEEGALREALEERA